MRLKELRGLPVIDPTAARKIGTVLDYQVDPASGRLAAVDITSVAEGDGERVVAARIRRVGRNAVVLTGRGGSVAGPSPEVDERWLDASTLSGLEVMGDDGNRVGRVEDATFDQDSLEIDAYLLRSSVLERLIGRRRRIAPVKVHSCSRELMLVSSGRLKDAPAPSLDEPSPPALRVQLKTDDRVAAPSFDQVPDGQTVGAHSS
ncbi:MAG TPA: PRC-barrel domain-containing protein [Chloroflexota bacterium]|nr:PRC-barrel domain-containing protein [Chloroflexota bacterium]